MKAIREMICRLFQWTPRRLWLRNWQKALFWWVMLAFLGLWAGLYFKHPNLLSMRAYETPIMFTVACIGAWSARRVRKIAMSVSLKRESGLRLLASILLVALVVGQEGWFRWQQWQVLRGGHALSRVGQHFVVGLRNFDEVKPLAERGLIGGIYITQRNLKGETAESLKERIGELQALRAKAGLPPLFVMADQEGGKVSHLSPLIMRMPSLSSLLAGDEEDLESRAYAYGEHKGRLLAEVGINMNLAPVVDLKIKSTEQWTDLRTRIVQRAIDSDPWIVTRVASAYGEGLSASGVQPTVKHFPGLGRVKADTHFVKASLKSDPVEQAADWLPFREVTARTGAAMMLAHVMLPDIDPNKPVSLSRVVVQDVLRKADGMGWNYQGLLITDDLNMGAVYSDGIGQAAISALDAGVDLLLVSYDPDQYYRAIYATWQAWKRGDVNAGREIESANRLDQHWKQRRTSFRAGLEGEKTARSAPTLQPPS